VSDDYELSVAREAALSAAQAVAASTAAVRSVNATASQTWNPGKFDNFLSCCRKKPNNFFWKTFHGFGQA